MRKKLIGLFVLAGLAGLLLVPTFSTGRLFGQPGGGGGKKGGKGKGGGGGGMPDMSGMFGGKGGKKGGGMPGMNMRNIGNMMDPDAMFDMIAKGSDAIVIATSGMLKTPLEQWAAANNVTNGLITRQQFGAFFPSMMSGISGRMGVAGNGTVDLDAAAVRSFKKLDIDGDGKLNEREMSPDLKAVWIDYDVNRDGFIDLDEYKIFYRNKVGQQKDDLGATIVIVEEEWEKLPTMYRAGKLPPELMPGGPAAWFSQCDKDSDGQVGLYEWKQYAGKPIALFQQMDRNGDGLLTPEEVMWYLKLKGGGGGFMTQTTGVTQLPGQQPAWQMMPGMNMNMKMGGFGNGMPNMKGGKGKGGGGGMGGWDPNADNGGKGGKGGGKKGGGKGGGKGGFGGG